MYFNFSIAQLMQDLGIPLPIIAQHFIKLFDGFYLTPKLRLLLPEFEFTIDIPDEVIEQINIDEVRELIKETKISLAEQYKSVFE